MLKGLFKDTAIYTIARFISFGLNIILIPIYVRFLGKAELGVFDLLNLFTSIITLTVALEIAQGVARFYPESTDKSKKKAYASTALIFSIIMYAIFSVVSWIFSSSFSVMLLNSEQYQAAFQITIISTFFRGLYNLLNNQLRYEVKPGMFAIVSIILIVSTAVISIVLVAVIQNGVYGLIYGQLVGLVITTVVELFLLRKHIGFIFDVGKFKEMLVFSLPLVVSSVGVFVTNSIDRLSISKIMTMEDVGLYGIGFRFASMIGVIFSGFQISLTPLIYSTYKNPDTPEKIAQIFRYFLVVVFILLFGISLYAKEILYFFTKPEYYSAWVVIPILAFSIILNNIYLFTPGMAISKKTGWIMLINIVAAVINTAGNILLIPKFADHRSSIGKYYRKCFHCGDLFYPESEVLQNPVRLAEDRCLSGDTSDLHQWSLCNQLSATRLECVSSVGS